MSAAAVDLQPPATLYQLQHSRRPEIDLAFIGILLYLLMEYGRVTEMFPALAPLQLGKVTALLAAIGLLVALRPTLPAVPARGRVELYLGLFLLASLISCLFARYPEPAWTAFGNSVRLGITFFLISRIVNSSWRLKTFVILYLLLNIKIGQFTIRSYFSGLLAGVSEQQLAGGVGAGSTSFFGNSNDLGLAMVVVWPIAGMLFFGNFSRLGKMIALAGSGVLLGAIIFSGSRGALLGAVVIAAVAVWRSPKRIAGLVMLALLAVGVFVLQPDANRDRVHSAINYEDDGNAQIRLKLWTAGVEMFRDHPIFGVGLGNFGQSYKRQYATYADAQAWAPHSIYVHAFSELGIVGFLPLGLLWISFFRMNAATRRTLLSLGTQAKGTFEYQLSVGLDLAMVGFLVSGAFITVLYYPHQWFVLGMAAALHGVCAEMSKKAASNDAPPANGEQVMISSTGTT